MWRSGRRGFRWRSRRTIVAVSGDHTNALTTPTNRNATSSRRIGVQLGAVFGSAGMAAFMTWRIGPATPATGGVDPGWADGDALGDDDD